MNRPKVSVITTAYNYARYLPHLWESLQYQVYGNFEWIVVDDASTDETFAYMMHVVEEVDSQRYASAQCLDEPHTYRDVQTVKSIVRGVHYVRLTKNHGYGHAKNVGIQAATGEYFVMIDADDVLTPYSLTVRVAALQEHPDKLWVHGDALNLSLEGQIQERYIEWIRNKRKHLEAEGWDLTKQYHHRLIHAQTVMMRREFYERFGLYDESLRFSGDNEMWRRAIRFGCIPIHLEKAVAIYRVHNQRMSRSEYKRKRVAAAKEYIKRIVEIRYKEGISSANTPMLEAR